jgi:hypothetical protein
MKKSNFSPNQIVNILKAFSEGASEGFCQSLSARGHPLADKEKTTKQLSVTQKNQQKQSSEKSVIFSIINQQKTLVPNQKRIIIRIFVSNNNISL